MGQENLELIRRQLDAVNRGDVEALLLGMDSEIEFIPARGALQGAYHGHDGVREWFTDTRENFDLFQASNEEVRDLGDRAVVFGTLLVRGKESGAEVPRPTAIVLTFRDGKIVHFQDFGDRSRALEALGLSE